MYFIFSKLLIRVQEIESYFMQENRRSVGYCEGRIDIGTCLFTINFKNRNDIQIHLASKSEKVPECFLTPFGFNEASDFEPDYGEPVKIQFRYRHLFVRLYLIIVQRKKSLSKIIVIFST